MQFDIITIFPNLFDSYLKESFIKKASDKGILKINVHDLRKWTDNERRTVDDRPYGGGLGMVLKVEPIFKAIKEMLKKNKKKKSRVILFTPRGKTFNQKKAFQLTKYDDLIFICGRYEGVDERVAKHIADEEISIGEYDLMGGELPAMVVIETISRMIPNVLGKPVFLKERMTKKGGFIEYPEYTRPEVFEGEKGKKWKVPEILLSGHQKKIQEWKEQRMKVIEK